MLHEETGYFQRASVKDALPVRVNPFALVTPKPGEPVSRGAVFGSRHAQPLGSKGDENNRSIVISAKMAQLYSGRRIICYGRFTSSFGPKKI